ncbi:uncharacterized protein LOC143592435 [Bidens hawaiensis]|uniref:uncharacterized protein LOC143592435 n=1 Tax=Bidens hawaiensis TaxID=980011 RepID=UPI00404B2D03
MDSICGDVITEGNHKLVPWVSWTEWNSVRESLFSSNPSSIHSALQRISTWQSRGCLPVVVEVTASILQTRQKDSHFRDGTETDLLAENVLTMLYCMTVIRLVNGIVDKTRKKNEISIGEAADAIGIPRMLIDIRHECSHRDLPSLSLVRLASTKALDWLKSYYWEPQKMAIPYASDRTANFEKEIKSKIRELAFNLDVNQATSSDSPIIKRKRSKKHINKALKNVLKLYSSFPSEVVPMLLEFLLKAHKSGDMANGSQLDDWKPLIIKLSNKEPDMLLSLLKAVVHMIETRQALEHISGTFLCLSVKMLSGMQPMHTQDLSNPFQPRVARLVYCAFILTRCIYLSGELKTEHLSYLFKWLVGSLNDLKPSRRKITTAESVNSPKDKSLPKSTLIDLMVKCLTVSSHRNNHLASAASVLAHTVGNHSLVQKLNKLASLHASNMDSTISQAAHLDLESFYYQQQMFIKQESTKLELLKQKQLQKMKLKKKAASVETKKKWSVVKSWRPCAIGMLPCDVGSSGVVPVLDSVDDVKEEEDKDLEEKKICGNKREADCALVVLDDSDVKKVKCCEEEDGLVLAGVKNGLMIGGFLKSVTEDEVMHMASSVRILV